ncbi:heterokaryon incompatibility protein-domain-containing protein [Aspergillus arachidicola]|uniref:Heterokaryon incompatibility protein-domain-containing protein n=1 Tax=Aspergillus arachidicola TaxID=656916 RepID=A0A5N6XWJ4_9EURO|nr:heterokaryon incompatibility protein-domain-containing protein [Aspergillus arachidicola]
MPGYEYSPLPTGYSSIRVLLLLPSTDDTASINCQLINYSLPTTGDGYLPYEALSYVWGSESTPRCIFLDGTTLSITDNLYAALLHLRDHQLPRMLWVDAVCINQQDEQEKGYQIQLMPTIYGRASHVIVWLGEAADHSDRALEDIRLAADDEPFKYEPARPREKDYTAILTLLQRPWFRRIWVLQEISAARSILVMCGHFKINGIAFASGLNELNLTNTDYASSGLENTIRSITYLMRGAISRPDYVTRPYGMLSLGELIDMYHTREATKKHDKVYALLGMSADRFNKADLLPNYQLPWDILLQRVIMSILPEIHSVETWPDKEIAVLQGRGYILGRIDAVNRDSFRYDRQRVKISFKESLESQIYMAIWGTEWTLQATARSIKEGDLVCLFSGAWKPSIVTMCEDYFAVKVINAVHRKEGNVGMFSNMILRELPQELLQSEKTSLREMLLVWNWEVSRANSVEEGQLQVSKSFRDAVPYLEIDFERKRQHDMELIVNNITMIAREARGYGKRTMELLRQETGPNLPIIEEIVKRAVRRYHMWKVVYEQVLPLFDQRKQHFVTHS